MKNHMQSDEIWCYNIYLDEKLLMVVFAVNTFLWFLLFFIKDTFWSWLQVTLIYFLVDSSSCFSFLTFEQRRKCNVDALPSSLHVSFDFFLHLLFSLNHWDSTEFTLRHYNAHKHECNILLYSLDFFKMPRIHLIQ